MSSSKYTQGDSVGQLKLIEALSSKTRAKSIIWLTECKCGHREERSSAYLTKIKNPSCRSCWKSHKYTGTAHIDGTRWCEILSGCKEKNRQRKVGSGDIEISLTIQQADDLLVAQNFKCGLSGLDLIMSSHNRQQKKYDRGTASLDRIDSSKGYHLSNVMWVHKDVNKMKMDFPLDRFIEVCKLVASIH